jgi:tetrapyrrole methylase family protein/MazG family protein
MGSITIVGLGPGRVNLVTREAWVTIESCSELWLRTTHHPVVDEFPGHLRVYSFDELYEEAKDFAEAYDVIVERVLELGGRPQGVVYAVPGHPLVGEGTATAIAARAAASGLPVHFVSGISFIEPCLVALQIDALDGLQVCDAVEVASRDHPAINPDAPALLGQLYSGSLASDLKLTLMNQYPEEHPLAMVYSAGTDEQMIVHLPLFELDRQPTYGHLATLYVPPVEAVGSFEGLQDTVARLRAPQGGCPWDREQTHVSLRSSLLEEAYEVAAAIDAEDTVSLQEELGDLLLQVVMHAQIATEGGEFKMASVIRGIDRKLRHRHPHVWGNAVVQSASDVLDSWEELKRAEKGSEASVLDGVPGALPALQRADTFGRRAARIGFDWAEVNGVADKVVEEIAEVRAAATVDERQAELGDLLFAVVNWARWLGVDAEVALQKANLRFADRFRYMESRAQDAGVDLSSLSAEDLDALWCSAKEDLGKQKQ